MNDAQRSVVSGEGAPPRAARRLRRTLLVAALTCAAAGGVATSQPSPARADVPPCVVDTTDVLGWWRGEDDLAAQIGPDLMGAVSFDDGAVGRGMVLDPQSELVVNGFPAVSDGMTVEMWVKPADLRPQDGTQALATRWDFPGPDDSARSYELLLDSTSDLVWSTDDISTRRPVELRAQVPQIYDGQYHHVAATRDASTMTLYLDGVAVAEQPSQGGLLNSADGVQFRLGGESGIGDEYRFTGTMDEPTIWSRALRSDEVAAINAAGSSGKCTFVPVEQAELTASSGSANDRFGQSVGISGTTIVVGAPFSSIATQFSGAAYVYIDAGTAWQEQATLVAADPRPSDLLGWSVDIDDDTIVVGSYGNNGAGTDSGAVYVFTRTGSSWTQQAKLLAADGAAGDGFGYSVAVDGDTIVVGSPLDDHGAFGSSGSAYIFTREGTTWSQQAALTPTNVSADANFGAAVAIDADSVLIGSPGDDSAAADAGAAYVFARVAGAWSQDVGLTPPDASAVDQFGYSVGIAANRLIIGAPSDDDQGDSAGAAYVYARDSSGWTNESKLFGSDEQAGDRFGVSAAISASAAVVGAYTAHLTGYQSGSAYVFSRSPVGWNELTKLVAAETDAGDQFGIAVAISGNIVVGAHLDDTHGNNSGSAYVFGS